MRFLLISALLAFVLNAEAQRGRIVLPTTDLSLNGGIALGTLDVSDMGKTSGNLLIGNVNITSNQPYGRHIFEVGFGSAMNDLQFDDPTIGSQLNLKSGTVNYAYMHELFSYYPSCQIANQVLLGLRFNADFLFTHNYVDATSGYYPVDYSHQSIDVSLATDYNFDKNNYWTLQLYTPILTRFTGGDRFPDANAEIPVIGDRLSADGWFDTNSQSMFIPDHFKFGAVTTYRIMFSDVVGLLFKYHGKLGGKTDYVDETVDPSQNITFKQSFHELTLGLIFHRENQMR